MKTLRTVDGLIKYFKSQDPDSAISENYVRNLIKNGQIPVLRSGVRTLISVEDFEAFVEREMRGDLT